MRASELENELAYQVIVCGLPGPVSEYRFAPKRRFRFDFAWPERKLAVEVEGGTWMSNGRHTTGKGFAGDCEKYNLAAELGWTVLRYTAAQIRDGSAVSQIERVLG